MGKASKLYARLLQKPQPSIKFRDFEKLLSAFGFMLDRTVGSHRQYVHPKANRSLPIQPDSNEAKRYQVRQFLDMIEEFGLSLEE